MIEKDELKLCTFYFVIENESTLYLALEYIKAIPVFCGCYQCAEAPWRGSRRTFLSSVKYGCAVYLFAIMCACLCHASSIFCRLFMEYGDVEKVVFAFVRRPY